METVRTRARVCFKAPEPTQVVRKQLELLTIDKRSAESTLAMALLNAPSAQDVRAALTATPGGAETAQASSVAISTSAAAQALADHMTPKMRQNLRDMSPEDFKKGISSVFCL